MELAELIDAVRELLDDRVEPHLHSDADLTRHFNDAVMEACIRTRVLQDSDSDLCRIEIKAGQGTYDLDPAIFAVRRARMAGQHDPIERVDVSQLDQRWRGWDDPDLAQRGTPAAACFDYGTGRMTLVPTPDADGWLHLLVWRGPTVNERLRVEAPEHEPVLPPHMHRELKHWVAGQAMLNRDAEQQSELASAQLAQFEAAYGRKPTLHEIRLWSTNHRTRVRAHFD